MFISRAEKSFQPNELIERRYRRRWWFASHLALYLFGALLLALADRASYALLWMPLLILHTCDHVFYELRQHALELLMRQQTAQTARAFFNDPRAVSRMGTVEFYDQHGRRVDASNFYVRPVDLLPPPR